MRKHFAPRSVRPTAEAQGTQIHLFPKAVRFDTLNDRMLPVPICSIWESLESDWEESKKFLGKLLEMTGKTQMSFPSHFFTLK